MPNSFWILYRSSYDDFKSKLTHNVIDLNTKNEFGKTFLHYEEDIKKIKLALKHGADINIQDDENGDTPLMRSISEKPLLFKFLLDNGSDIEIKNKAGRNIHDEIIHEFDVISDSHTCNCNLPMQHKKCRKCKWYDELNEMKDYLDNHVNKKITLFELMKPCLEESDKQRRFQ